MSKKSTLVFIGTIKKVANCGESVKNHLFIKRFQELFDRVISIDVFQPKKHPFCVIKTILVLLFHRHDKVVLSVSPVTANKFLKLLLLLNCDNVYYWAVGISIIDCFENNRFYLADYNRIRAIYVQSPRMVDSLKEIGLNNVQYVPNSKPITYYPIVESRDNPVIRFVFFSRMDPNKGCELILNCSNKLAEEGYKDKFLVDFYGLVTKSKKNWFDSFLIRINNSANCDYKGFIVMNEDGYRLLSTYDAMLFPSFYDGEAFPGVLIDCFIAGVPIVASDWHFNKDFVTDNLGIIIPPKDEEALYLAMKSIIDGHVNLNEMSLQCQIEAKKYDNKEVLSVSNLKKIGFID